MTTSCAAARRWPRWVLLPALAVAISLAIGAVLIGVAWYGAIPWSVWHGVHFGFLYSLRLGYPLLFVSAPAGAILCAALVLRARRRHQATPRLVRGLALCISTCVGVALAEASAAAWWIHAHRAPVLRPPFDASTALPTRFSDAGGGAEVRILVVGESSACGTPYDQWISVGHIVAWQLERAMPGRRFRIDMLAQPGDHLEQQHQKLSRITQRPDVMIIYSGHNEFYSRFSTTRAPVPYADQMTQRPRRALVLCARRISAVYRLIEETIEQRTVALRPPVSLRRKLVSVPTYSPAEYVERLADFRQRLEAMVAYCDAIDCLPILVIPPGNDGDDPNRSILPPQTRAAERAAFGRDFLTARQAEADRPGHAQALYRALLDRQPGFAETHFRLARLLEEAQAWEEAYQHYVRARDLDGHPQRCPSDFQNAYRAVAARHPRALLVDGQAVCRDAGPHGLVNDWLFGDGMHPSLRGYIALASAILTRLHERHALGWPDDTAAPVVDPAECVQHFKVDRACWVAAAKFGALYYHFMSGVRYDMTERSAKYHRFKTALARFAAGADADDAGVPSLGILPVPLAGLPDPPKHTAAPAYKIPAAQARFAR